MALVNAGKYFGFNFLGRDEQNNISVSINGKTETFALLNVIEFTSDRKRMTTIVKMPDNTIKVMCKGADSIILARLGNSKETTDIIKSTNDALDGYASTGLRTLLLCEKTITVDQYKDWLNDYRNAATAMIKRDEKMEEVADRLERNFELIGCTAIEDKLQDEVD